LKSARIEIVRNVTWAISNLCRSKPAPAWELVEPFIVPLHYLLHYATDDEILCDTCFAFSYLSDGNEDRIQTIISIGIANRVVQLLSYNNAKVQTPAIRIIGNIVTGSDEQTQAILDSGILRYIIPLLEPSKKSLCKEACWVLSNITAGTPTQIEEVIRSGIVPYLIKLAKCEISEIKRESSWSISNATSGNPEHVKYLVENGTIELLCELLEDLDIQVIIVCLDGIDNILRSGFEEVREDEANPYVHLIEQCKGVDKLEELQNHENTDIYQKSVTILEEYFEISVNFN